MACRQISPVHQRSGRRDVFASGTGRVGLYSQRCQNRPLDLFRPSLPTSLERSCGQPSRCYSISPLLVRRAAIFDRYLLFDESRLYFCARHLANVHLFSSSPARIDNCHKTSRIFTRTGAEVLVSSFWWKWPFRL